MNEQCRVFRLVAVFVLMWDRCGTDISMLLPYNRGEYVSPVCRLPRCQIVLNSYGLHHACNKSFHCSLCLTQQKGDIIMAVKNNLSVYLLLQGPSILKNESFPSPT